MGNCLKIAFRDSVYIWVLANRNPQGGLFPIRVLHWKRESRNFGMRGCILLKEETS